MNIKMLMDMRKRILSDVEKEFTDELIPVKLTEDEGGKNCILNVLISGSDEEMGNASGEFFFLPSAVNDDIQYFVCLITLYDSVPVENVSELCAAIAGINTYVTTGGFGMDFGSGSLIYKFTCPMSIYASEDVIRDNVDLYMGCAFQAISDYGYLLTEVCEGERDAESVVEVISGEN